MTARHLACCPTRDAFRAPIRAGTDVRGAGPLQAVREDLEKGWTRDSHHIAAELEEPRAKILLETAPLCRLAYNGTDGQPRVIPIGFHWDGAELVICTATTSPKVRALTARPGVAVTIDVGNTPADAQSVLVRGVATLETVDGVPDEYIAGAAKVMDVDQVPVFERIVRQTYEQMVRITIVPRWARYYDFGAGRLPAFLTELTSNA